MKFGTSGLRGLAADMTNAAVADYVQAFLEHLAATGDPPRTVLVGRDLRPSSPRIAAVCRETIRRSGSDVVDCGVLPTPAIALEAASRGGAAVMVTGSHIPFDRNGLKFYKSAGEINKTDEAGILAALGAPTRSSGGNGDIQEDGAALSRYRIRNVSLLPPGALKRLRIGVYQHSSVGRDLIVEVLAELGADTVALGRTENFIPIDTEAVRTEDAALARKWTAEHGLDALVATDGDGDRPLIADERGVFLRGDVVGLLTARILGADALATPITSSTAAERSGWVAKVARTRVGSPFVIEALERLAAEGAHLPVGYEANGGFLLGASTLSASGATLAPLPTRDAMLPILTLLGEVSRRSVPLSAVAAETPRRITASDRLPDVAVERSARLLRALAKSSASLARLAAALGRAVTSIDTLDGVRMTLEGDEIAHLRASGNAPELRAYAEAGDPVRARALVERLLAAAAEQLA